MTIVLIAAAVIALGFLIYYLSFGRKVQCRSCGYYQPARSARCPRCGYAVKKDEVPPLIRQIDQTKK